MNEYVKEQDILDNLEWDNKNSRVGEDDRPGMGVMTMPDLKSCPCKDCIVRGRFAIGLDMHFWGDNCPYKCDAYDNWNRRAGEEDKHD